MYKKMIKVKKNDRRLTHNACDDYNAKNSEQLCFQD